MGFGKEDVNGRKGKLNEMFIEFRGPKDCLCAGSTALAGGELETPRYPACSSLPQNILLLLVVLNPHIPFKRLFSFVQANEDRTHNFLSTSKTPVAHIRFPSSITSGKYVSLATFSQNSYLSRNFSSLTSPQSVNTRRQSRKPLA